MKLFLYKLYLGICKLIDKSELPDCKMRTLTALFNDFSVHETIELVIDYEDYGNTGCGVFKGGIQN